MTEAGRAYLSLDSEPHHQLPTIPQLQRTLSSTQILPSQCSHPPLDVFALRSVLKDGSVEQLQRVREQASTKAYRSIKEELLRDISNHRNFLSSKAENMTKKIMQQNERLGGSISIDVGKAKNYIGKIIKDYQERQEEDGALRKHLKVKASKKYQLNS